MVYRWTENGANQSNTAVFVDGNPVENWELADTVSGFVVVAMSDRAGNPLGTCRVRWGVVTVAPRKDRGEVAAPGLASRPFDNPKSISRKEILNMKESHHRVLAALVVAILAAIVMIHVLGAVALAAGLAQTPVPSDPSAILLWTVGQLVQWILASGITLFVGWLLGFFQDVPTALKIVVGGLLIAMLSAGVTYLSGQLTPGQLDMSLLQVIVFVGTALLSLVGQLVGQLQGQAAYVRRQEVKVRLIQLKLAAAAIPGPSAPRR